MRGDPRRVRRLVSDLEIALIGRGNLVEGFGKSKRVAICHGPHCSQRNSAALYDLLERELAAQGLEDEVGARPGACNKLCEIGPSMVVHPDKVWYARLTPDAVRQIVRQHLSGGPPVKRWVAKDLRSPAERAAQEKVLPGR